MKPDSWIMVKAPAKSNYESQFFILSAAAQLFLAEGDPPLQQTEAVLVFFKSEER